MKNPLLFLFFKNQRSNILFFLTLFILSTSFTAINSIRIYKNLYITHKKISTELFFSNYPYMYKSIDFVPENSKEADKLITLMTQTDQTVVSQA